MKRLRNCPGSLRLSKTVPNSTSVYAAEGTEAHTLAKDFLEARRGGRPEPDTFGHDPEMLEYVRFYVDHVMALGHRYPGAVQYFEHRFSLEHVYPGSFGTCDAVTYFPQEQLLIATDLKYGGGVFVPVERNDQLMYYALGAWYTLPDPKPTKIILEIVQPRYRGESPVRSFETDDFDLFAWQGEMKEICEATENPMAELKAGDWCRFCPAAAANICPLLKAERASIARRVFKDERIVAVDMKQFSEDLKMVPLLAAQFKLMHEYAYQLAMNGQDVPGWKLVDKRATRKFKDEKEAASRLFDEAGVIITKTVQETMSPAQVEDLKASSFTIPKKEVKEIISSLVEWKSSGYALVPEADERNTVKKIEGKSVFALTDPTIDALN